MHLSQAITEASVTGSRHSITDLSQAPDKAPPASKSAQALQAGVRAAKLEMRLMLRLLQQ